VRRNEERAFTEKRGAPSSWAGPRPFLGIERPPVRAPRRRRVLHRQRRSATTLTLARLADRGGATSAPSLQPPPACRWADWPVRHGALGRRRRCLLEPLVKPGADLLGCQLRPLPLLTGDDDTGGRNTGDTGETENLPEVHEQETFRE